MDCPQTIVNARRRTRALLIVGAALLFACGGGGTDGRPSATTHSISGNVAGLSGSLVLLDDGADDLGVSASGPFTFATKLAPSAA
jgi:hypothetical protein